MITYDFSQLSLPLPDDNADALIIILNILHDRNRQVPKRIPLSTLAHLSILADKYQILESIETFVSFWVTDREIQKSLPSTSGPSLYPWLSIAWVFHLPLEFKQLTRIVMHESKSDISVEQHEGYDLPIPELLISK